MSAENKENYVIYVDTGGTFSDAVLVTKDGQITTGKADTSYDNLANCFFDSISNACRQKGL